MFPLKGGNLIFHRFLEWILVIKTTNITLRKGLTQFITTKGMNVTVVATNLT